MKQQPDQLEQSDLSDMHVLDRVQEAVSRGDAKKIDKWFIDFTDPEPYFVRQRLSDILHTYRDAKIDFVAICEEDQDVRMRSGQSVEYGTAFTLYRFSADKLQSYIVESDLNRRLSILVNETVFPLSDEMLEKSPSFFGFDDYEEISDLKKAALIAVKAITSTDHEGEVTSGSEAYQHFKELSDTDIKSMDWSLTDDKDLLFREHKNVEVFTRNEFSEIAGRLEFPIQNPYLEMSVKENPIVDIIKKGETQRIEFKETLLYDVHQDQPNKELKEDAVKEIAAMLNTDGGKLIFGVDDSGEIVGLNKDKKIMNNREGDRDSFEGHLEPVISEKLGNVISAKLVDIDFKRIDSKDICVVHIAKSPKPVFFGHDEKFFIRKESSKGKLTPKEFNDFRDDRFDN